MLTRAVCPRADRRPLVGLLIVRRSGRDDAVGRPREEDREGTKKIKMVAKKKMNIIMVAASVERSFGCALP